MKNKLWIFDVITVACMVFSFIVIMFGDWKSNDYIYTDSTFIATMVLLGLALVSTLIKRFTDKSE